MSRHCQRGEGLENIKYLHNGASFDRPAEARYPQRHGDRGNDSHIANDLGSSCELVRSKKAPAGGHPGLGAVGTKAGGMHVGEGLVSDHGIDAPRCSRGEPLTSAGTSAGIPLRGSVDHSNNSEITTNQPGRQSNGGFSYVISGRSVPQKAQYGNAERNDDRQSAFMTTGQYAGILVNGAGRQVQSVDSNEVTLNARREPHAHGYHRDQALGPQSIDMCHVSIPGEAVERSGLLAQVVPGHGVARGRADMAPRQEVDFDYAQMRRQTPASDTASKDRRIRTQTFSPYRANSNLERQQMKENTQYPSTYKGKSMSPLKKLPISGEGTREHVERALGPRGSIPGSQNILSSQAPSNRPDRQLELGHQQLDQVQGATSEPRVSSILSSHADQSLAQHLPISPI